MKSNYTDVRINDVSLFGGGGSGEANTASNLGTGEGVFSSKVGVDIRLKSLLAGTGISLSSDTNGITITNTGGGGSADGSETKVNAGSNVTVSGTGTAADPYIIGATASGATGEVYIPTSVSDLTNASNANKIAIISGSFSVSGATFAANQTIIPAGGALSGTGINLNGATIVNTFRQAFASTARFSAVYSKSRLSPETFGAVSGDASDDNNAIDALIINCSMGINLKGGSYIKNDHSQYTRSGVFDWDLNGSKISTTSTANFAMTTVSVDYVFDFQNISPTIYNGEYDGTDTYGRFVYLRGQNHYAFRNMYIHNLYSPVTIRCVAFRIDIDATASGFRYGEFSGCRIENIVAEGDGDFNNSPAGVCKVWWYSMGGPDLVNPYTVVHRNNYVNNVIGDDAEAFYNQQSGNYYHESYFVLENEHYRNCTRRACKITAPNLRAYNNYFEEIPESLFGSAQQMGSMFDVFSTSATYLLRNIYIKGNTFKTANGERPHYHILSLTEVENAFVSDNTFDMYNVANYAGIRLGSGTSTYAGILKNVNISNNQLINCGVQVLQYYDAQETLNISNNSFNYNDISYNWGNDSGALRFSQTTGTVDANIFFADNTVLAALTSSSSLFNGVVNSNGAAVQNLVIKGCTMFYSGSTATRPFGYMEGNFDNTNYIIDCRIIGDSGTDALVVLGATQSVNVVNSFDAAGSPITVS